MANITFGLVHGAWHGSWCWKYLQKELRNEGFKSIAVDLPIDDPHADFEDYADVVAHSLKGESEITLVGHSLSGNVIPRVAGRIAVKKLIYLAAAFDPETIGRPFDWEKQIVPERFGKEFLHGIVKLDNNMTVFDKHTAESVFYPDCHPTLKEWASRRLRPQLRADEKPVMSEWPDVSQEYILCTKDEVVSPRWSRYATEKWLNIQPIEIESGHSPFLSRPQELAKLLISLAQN